jgi:hypothetical protein
VAKIKLANQKAYRVEAGLAGLIQQLAVDPARPVVLL